MSALVDVSIGCMTTGRFRKANNTKNSDTKLPRFNRLLRHSARKRGGLILQCSRAHTNLEILTVLMALNDSGKQFLSAVTSVTSTLEVILYKSTLYLHAYQHWYVICACYILCFTCTVLLLFCCVVLFLLVLMS